MTEERDLIGPAGHLVKQLLTGKVKRLRESKTATWRLLLVGQPGVGKTDGLGRLVRALVEDPNQVHRLSGRAVNTHTVGRWMQEQRVGSLLPGWNVKWIEEMDTMPRDAQDLTLQLLDEMPGQHAVVGTSNLDYEELSERFQSRFQIVEVAPPTAPDIWAMLKKRYPQLPARTLDKIANDCAGNVRAALLDVENHLDAEAL